jgi:hypothetical protein
MDSVKNNHSQPISWTFRESHFPQAPSLTLASNITVYAVMYISSVKSILIYDTPVSFEV